MDDVRWSHPTYLVRRKIMKLFGAAFHIYDPAGNLAFFSDLKAFKLKEDIRVYADESKSQELLAIAARNIIDFSATYDVIDPVRRENVGSLRRKGLKSIIKDEWIIMNNEDQEVGIIKEASTMGAIAARMGILALFFPQSYIGEIQGQPLCTFKNNYNPFVSKVTLDFSNDRQGLMDRRLGVAAAILLNAIEGKQN